MQICELILRYNENFYGFPEDARRAATFDREILKVAEYVLGSKRLQKDLASKEGSSSESNGVNRGGSRNKSANDFTSSNRNNNPSNKNNNGFRLVCTASEHTVLHSPTPPLRRCVEEHAQPSSDSSASDRLAGNHLEGVNEK